MIKASFRWLSITISALGIGSSIAISEIYFSRAIDKRLPEVEKVNNFTRPGTLTFLSSNGSVIQKLGPVTREKLDTEAMPLLIKKAFIAAEDRRFYKHRGVDFWSILRAMVNNIQERKVIEGGSTITQQLARIVYLKKEKTFTRKLKEAALAFKLERELSKEEIIEKYLNNVYLGSNAYGIADAAWIYFSKTPQELNIQEAALIAGLAPAPSLYSPLVNPQLALIRRKSVLKKMQKEGFINKKELTEALESPLYLRQNIPKYSKSLAPFFTSWAFQKLPLLLSPEQIEVGGLTIHTSLNINWQLKAKEIIKNSTPENTQGAIVSIEPKTGLIKVLVGGKDYQKNQFNRATQALRSPGSTFKLFVYAAAIEEGLKPEDKIIDKPICWNGYCPKNFGNLYYGEVSIEESLVKSLNTVAVQLLDQVGFKKVISLANRLGIGTLNKLGNYYPLAIGAYDETLLNMTTAYAAVANRGVYIQPTPIEKITGPNKTVLWKISQESAPPKRVLRKDVADTLNLMLIKSVRDGTGFAAKIEGAQIAGKTGTSEGGRDLWFIGSIPGLTTGIWFGHDDYRQTGSSSGDAALAWKKYISSIKSDLEFKNFPSK